MVAEKAGSVTVDFLIPPSAKTDRGGSLRSIERDFAAVIAPGLALAFQDRRQITLEGVTIVGEKASRKVWVCGAGAFVILKALSFRNRGDGKDAYDLYYVVRNFGHGVEDVAACLKPRLQDPDAVHAIEILREDFLDFHGLGPRRVAEFLLSQPNDAIRADVAGFVRQLFNECGLGR